MDKDNDLEIKERDAWIKKRREAQVFATLQLLYQYGNDLLMIIKVYSTKPIERDSVLEWHFSRSIKGIEELLRRATEPSNIHDFDLGDIPKLPSKNLLTSLDSGRIQVGNLSEITYPLFIFIDRLRSRGCFLSTPKVRDKDEPFVLHLQSVYKKKGLARFAASRLSATSPKDPAVASLPLGLEYWEKRFNKLEVGITDISNKISTPLIKKTSIKDMGVVLDFDTCVLTIGDAEIKFTPESDECVFVRAMSDLGSRKGMEWDEFKELQTRKGTPDEIKRSIGSTRNRVNSKIQDELHTSEILIERKNNRYTLIKEIDLT